jgi:hypothetical protein
MELSWRSMVAILAFPLAKWVKRLEAEDLPAAVPGLGPEVQARRVDALCGQVHGPIALRGATCGLLAFIRSPRNIAKHLQAIKPLTCVRPQGN